MNLLNQKKPTAGHDPCQVANYFINRALADQAPMTPLQVHKLAFLAHGWMLGIHKRPLVHCEFEAWCYGPIMPAIYHNLSYYGGDPVAAPVLARETPFDEGELDLMGQVYDRHRHLSGTELSAQCNRPDSPWEKTWRRHRRQAVIPDRKLQQHYEKIKKESTE